MASVVDNLNRPVAEGGVVITLRADLTGGVSLGGDQSIEPGETKRVDASIALQLIASGRAVVAVSVPPNVSDGPGSPSAATTTPPRRGRR